MRFLTQAWSGAGLAGMITAGAVALLSTHADAGFLRHRADEGDYAVAKSQHGNGTVSGPVRSGRAGYEVRLPSGTWIACRTSCSETLRVETVDLTETTSLTGYGTRMNECGIFGCIRLGR